MPNPDGSPTLQELIAQGPGAAPDANAPHPLGVSDNFHATTQTGPGLNVMDPRGALVHTPMKEAVDQPPRYFQGDEYRPANLTPDLIAQIQQGLIKAGLISSKASIHVGVWDEVTKDAYKKVLEHANRSGTKMQDAFRQLMDAPQVDLSGGPGANRQPLTVQLTSDQELDQTFRKTYIGLTGNAPTDDEIQRFIQGYHGIETTAQQQQYDMGPTGGTMQAPPTAGNNAEATVRMGHAEDVKSYDLVKQGGLSDTFASVLGKWSQ